MCEEGREFVWRGAGIEVPTQVPGCIADALCAAKAVPPPRQGLNALAGEWAAAREWTLCGRAALPVGKERAFLRARGVRGEGMLMVNGNEAGRFLSGDWEAEITAFTDETDSLEIGLRFDARPPEGTPRRALAGVYGGLETFGVNRLKIEDCYVCTAVRDGCGEAEFRAAFSPYVPGKYMFRCAAVYGGETLACEERAEILRAVRTERTLRLTVPLPRLWRLGGENEPVWLRLTVLQAGLVCDDRVVRTGFRTAAADEAGVTVNGEKTALRAACWPCGEPVAWERQERRLERLRACGINCLRVSGLPEETLLEWLDRRGMLCLCELPCDEQPAAQAVRRVREHPCVIAYCGENEALCRAHDGERPFLKTLEEPLACPALHGDLRALRDGTPEAPFWFARGETPFDADALRAPFGLLGAEFSMQAAPLSRFVQAETLRRAIEDARMRGENICLAAPFETVESPCSAALFDGEAPRPAWYAVQSALRRVHVFARAERESYPCGAEMEAEICLLYDAKTVPGPLCIQAALCDGTGRELARETFDAPPQTGTAGRFRARLPDVPGALILRTALESLGETLDVSDTIVCTALNAPRWPLAHAPYAAVRLENGEIRNACARAAYGVACGGYFNAAWPGWGALLPGECRAVRDETSVEGLNLEPRGK